MFTAMVHFYGDIRNYYEIIINSLPYKELKLSFGIFHPAAWKWISPAFGVK